jgi:condensin complex subunit 3
VYCFSSSINQRRIQNVFLPTLRFLLDAAEENEDEDADAHSAAQITALFLDWTDPQKSVYVALSVRQWWLPQADSEP